MTVTLAAVGRRPSDGQLLLATGVVMVLLARQYLTTLENSRLATSLARRETELHHQAFHDSLTGLPNRALFVDRLGHALALHARDLRAVSVLFLDLDDFKIINDTLGHAAGDELLTRAADRLLGAVRSGDTVARLGGDEFAILIEDQGDASIVAEKISSALQHPFTLGSDRQRTVTASIGVVILEPGDAAVTADVLVTRADTAMYAAKRAGKGQIAWHRAGMALREVADQGLAVPLAAAIDTGSITLMYQPVVELATGRPFGLEALARWRHCGEQIPPDVFIPIAQRLGLMNRLTEHALTTACAALNGWSAALGDHQLRVSVNLPPDLLTTPGFVPMVRGLLEKHSLQPGQLVLELTESGLFRDLTAARLAVTELHRHGVDIWLDDFGVGYSSFAQLHDVDFDLIKLDKAFVGDEHINPRQTAFLRGLLHLSADIGTTILAEGIERPDQLDHLRELGCTLGQGYLFSRPLTQEAVLDYLTSHLVSDRP